MNTNRIYLLTIAILLTSITVSHAQLLNRLKKRTMEKIENRLEEKVVEELSEEIARRAMQPVDKAFDSFLRESYRKEYGEDYSDEQIDSLMNSIGSNYTQFLEAMNQMADLPPSYTFDYQCTIESKEENGDKDVTTMWVGGEGSLLGMKQDNEYNFVIIDMKNDNIVMYKEEDGKKTAQALPSMMSMAGAMVASSSEFQDNMQNMNIEGPSKTKKIQGYNASLYKVETDEDISEYYISTEVPFSFHDGIYKSLTQYFPSMYGSEMESMKGMMLEGESYNKQTKKKSYFKTKDIKEQKVTINNAEYTQVGLME